MSIGVHCSKLSNFDLIKSLEFVFQELDESECAQIFTHGPHSTKVNNIDMEKLSDICKRKRIYIHQTYRVSWKDEPKNIMHMQDLFNIANEIGAQGVVLHLAKISPDEHITFLKKINQHGKKAYLEMRALKLSEWSYQSPDEINQLCAKIKEEKMEDIIEICIDTAHISASKIPIGTEDDAKKFLNSLEYPDMIGLLHLNGNTYDPNVRSGDHHCVPNTKQDFVFKSINAVKEWINWFIGNKKDVILEQDWNDELLEFYDKIV